MRLHICIDEWTCPKCKIMIDHGYLALRKNEIYNLECPECESIFQIVHGDIDKMQKELARIRKELARYRRWRKWFGHIFQGLEENDIRFDSERLLQEENELIKGF